ncbi:ABC transporter permease [Candidatus Hydrogenisulfobacillus filiaventi]|uniref:ABC transporter permease n=1 Tax=Candidatus Hydrogenisulfobacillus filiaventi TaxID=2707344 RepID=A0A6F8ZE08_9FIRM|nr:ABC transporter permease [Candidatus Hydrogenisulfobacillus filiaventi]
MNREARWRSAVPAALALGVLFGIWQLAVTAFRVPAYVLPTPTAILAAGVAHAGQIAQAAAMTTEAAVLGFLLATALGLVLATVFAHSRWMRLSFYPLTIAVQTTPVVAVAPLIVLWAGNGLPSRILIAAMITLFPLVVNTTHGLTAVPAEELALFQVYGAGRRRIYWHLRLPNSLPYLFAAMRIGATLAVIGTIVAEFITGNGGLGYVILESSYQLETALLFAALFAAALLGIAFFLLVDAGSRLALRGGTAGPAGA